MKKKNVGVDVLGDPREMKKTIVGTSTARPHCNSNGITLIALIITIIIMLILAGVAISIVISGGIFTQANRVVLETRGSAAEEEAGLWKVEMQMNTYSKGTVITAEAKIEEMRTKKLLTEEDVESLLTDGKYNGSIRQIGSHYVDFIIETSSETIPIYTVGQLEKICTNEIVNINGTDYTFTPSANYILMNDLDLSGWNTFGIGPYSKELYDYVPFTGSFNGNGKKLRNFEQIDTTEVGLFKRNNGIIKNLDLVDVNLTFMETWNYIPTSGTIAAENARQYIELSRLRYNLWCFPASHSPTASTAPSSVELLEPRPVLPPQSPLAPPTCESPRPCFTPNTSEGFPDS